jgi:hypothetical protein
MRRSLDALDPEDEARAHMRATLAHLDAERRWLEYLDVLDRYQALSRPVMIPVGQYAAEGLRRGLGR